MLLLIMVVLLIPYLAVGSKFARARYALERFNWEQNPVALSAADTKAQKELELKSLKHGICNLNYSGLEHKGCDCGSSSTWWALKRDIESAKVTMKKEPGLPLKEMTAWPFVMFGDYLKGGTVDKPNYRIIEELEKKELGL